MSTPVQLVAEGLVTDHDGRPALIGSRCRRCGEPYFPARDACTRCCASDQEPMVLGDHGTLWSWTVQCFLPKLPYDGGEDAAGFTPYGVGYVELPCGLKVEARLTTAEALAIGSPMRLVLHPYRKGNDGTSVHTFAFAPA